MVAAVADGVDVLQMNRRLVGSKVVVDFVREHGCGNVFWQREPGPTVGSELGELARATHATHRVDKVVGELLDVVDEHVRLGPRLCAESTDVDKGLVVGVESAGMNHDVNQFVENSDVPPRSDSHRGGVLSSGFQFRLSYSPFQRSGCGELQRVVN